MKKLIFFAVILAGLFTGCSKDDDDNNATGGNNNNNTNTSFSVSTPWQYSIKTDGTTNSATEGVANFQGSFSWSASITTLPDSSTTSFGSGLNDNNSINRSFSVTIGFATFPGNQCDTIEFKKAIHTGAYVYHGTGTNPVEIHWVDANGGIWSTQDGTGDQTGSTFTVTDVARVGIALGNLQLKFRATFNCKLYNMNTGASMTLTDGVYIGKVENYN
jgi:hypothetical protein